MKKRIIIILTIGVIAILLFYFLIIPLLGLVPFSASMTGQWYNGDDPVGNPFAFVNPEGSEVTNLRVTLTWTAAGVNVDESSFSLGGWIKISLLPRQPGTNIELEKFLITKSGASEMVGSTYGNFILSSLLSGHMDYEDIGWTLVLTAQLSAQVTDLEGETLTEQWNSPSVNYVITWSELDSSFSLVGSVSGGQ